ncbi:transglutaminase-like putative cysteine protease [Tamaricihabitans halophyticus]|uniref:Transglutaminase-like putative cysteine protease n=1 Tax=Tamaricihabitans halophyticus TaxID=1262583 RepID=A0A4R2QAW9_9PSEU|nr:transglutaminaseTgpA domain-containing protein [Tamaricihabitans halophyticus]TCP45394.1 transglutaminase-like putative cysteine protease [Tamaricihabitans halophyticus]
MSEQTTPRLADDWQRTLLTPVVAALATVSAASSLTGVVDGVRWFGFVLLAVLLITATGIVLRGLRVPQLLVGCAQLVGLLVLVVTLFTDSGILGFLPGPGALAELGSVLGAAAEEIRTGLPPVQAETPILCLVVIAIGLVAILVDALAVAAMAPAATGLVLLCVYAVPASLASDMLPWWTFLCGAASFALLLAVEGNHRYRFTRPHGTRTAGARIKASTTPALIACVSILLGLAAGSQITAIGTEGRLPGTGGGNGGGDGGLGIKPFTSLRGLLEDNGDTELFRVRGLADENHYLRTLTLNSYAANEGWEIRNQTMASGSPANGQLPIGNGVSDRGESRTIAIEPVNWLDYWLPVYGQPRELSGVNDNWRYDVTSGTVFAEREQRTRPYRLETQLAEPTAEELRRSETDGAMVDPVYTEADGIDQRVTDLTRRLTANAPTSFDKVTAIWRYFAPANGFTYDTTTAPRADSDALADFLLNGKRGYCEQYASSMAVMLRAAGIPSRVAIGFTAGYGTGSYRSIGSQDAHAWVEVFFEGHGWVTFDPTPLSDGRGYVPEYLRENQDPQTEESPDSPEESSPAPTSEPPEEAAAAPQDPSQGQDQRAAASPTPWLPWTFAAAGLLAIVTTAAAWWFWRRNPEAGRAGLRGYLPLLAGLAWIVLALLGSALISWWLTVPLVLLGIAAAPWAIRRFIRQRRLVALTARPASEQAAAAAWSELLAECMDRGTPIADGVSVRTAARRLSTRYHLDDAGKESLRQLVTSVERAWYAADRQPGPDLAETLTGVLAALHRAEPLPLSARLLPKSVLSMLRANRTKDAGEYAPTPSS